MAAGAVYQDFFIKTNMFRLSILSKISAVLFDDYAWNGFESTREVIEKFLEDKTGDFFHLPTGQAYFIKRK